MTLIHEHSTPRPIQGVSCMYGTFYKPYKTDRQIQDEPFIAFKCNGLLEKKSKKIPLKSGRGRGSNLKFYTLPKTC